MYINVFPIRIFHFSTKKSNRNVIIEAHYLQCVVEAKHLKPFWMRRQIFNQKRSSKRWRIVDL